MTKKLPPIAEAISQGGRAGSVETAEDGFRLQFREPTEAQSQGLTPEHLFGAAWAACFCGAVKHVAHESGHADEGITVTARVQLQPGDPKPFAVELRISLPGLAEDKARRVIAQAHEMCAYSRATQGHVNFTTALN